MAKYEITRPDGKYEVTGPDNMSDVQAHAYLQQHLGGQDNTPKDSLRSTPGALRSAASGLIEGAGAPGDLSNSVLGNAPPQQPVDQDTYYGKLVDALNMARKHLELPTTPQVGNAVGMQPTQPVTPLEKGIQGAARMIPGAAMGGAPGARAVMGTAGAANAVRGMGLSPSGPASAIGGAAGGVGDALQNQLLQAGLQHGAGTVGHVLGGPLGGMAGRAAAKFLPKVLGFDK